MARKAFVAGYFYPGSKGELEAAMARMARVPEGQSRSKVKALAVVCPHAGYEYSGEVAGAVYAGVEVPPTAVILGPAHRSIDPMFAIQAAGAWETPLGQSPVDCDLAAAILKGDDRVRDDPEAHDQEHSLEVQLPFLQHFRSDVSIVPIAVSYIAEYEDLEALGRALAKAIRESRRKVLIVASTDMSHYVPRARAEALDRLAIDAIVKLDPRGLYDVVRDRDISMCGVRPVTAALVAARELGASKGELVLYRTSGDRTGDMREVVGYAGLRVV